MFLGFRIDLVRCIQGLSCGMMKGDIFYVYNECKKLLYTHTESNLLKTLENSSGRN